MKTLGLVVFLVMLSFGINHLAAVCNGSSETDCKNDTTCVWCPKDKVGTGLEAHCISTQGDENENKKKCLE